MDRGSSTKHNSRSELDESKRKYMGFIQHILPKKGDMKQRMHNSQAWWAGILSVNLPA